MKKMKVFAAIMAILLTLSIFAGCTPQTPQPGQPTQAPQPGQPTQAPNPEQPTQAPDPSVPAVDSISIAYNKPLDTFSPVQGLPDQFTTSNIFEPLWRSVNKEIVPCIAESWEWEDTNTLKVKLHDNVVDSAGNKITAADVMYSFEKLKEIDSSNLQFVDVENSKADSDYEVTIITTTPAKSSIIEGIAYCWIFSKTAYEATSDTMALDPVGTGAYTLGEYVPNSHCMLEYNENWWQAKEAPQLKHIKIMFIADPAQRLNVLLANDVSYAYGLNFTDDVIVQATPGITSDIGYASNQLGIYFNMQSPLFADNLKLRQAICYAIDRDAINTINCSGLANVAHGITIRDGADYTDEFEKKLGELTGDPGWYDHDMEKAKALLAESGVAPGTKFRFLYYVTTGMDTLAKYLEGVFQELGLVLELDFQSSQPAMLAKLTSPDGYDITPLSLQSDPMALWFMLGVTGFNLVKWPDGEVKDQVTALSMGAYGAEGEQKQEMLLQLQKLYYDNCWEFPLYDSVGYSGRAETCEPFFNTFLYPDFTKWKLN